MGRLLGKALAGLGKGLSQSAAVALEWKRQEMLQKYANALEQLKQERADAREMYRQEMMNRRVASQNQAAYERTKLAGEYGLEKARISARAKLAAARLKATSRIADDAKQLKNFGDVLDKLLIDRREIEVRDEDGNVIGKLTQVTDYQGKTFFLGPDTLKKQLYAQLAEQNDLSDDQAKAFILRQMAYDDIAMTQLRNEAARATGQQQFWVDEEGVMTQWAERAKKEGVQLDFSVQDLSVNDSSLLDKGSKLLDKVHNAVLSGPDSMPERSPDGVDGRPSRKIGESLIQLQDTATGLLDKAGRVVDSAKRLVPGLAPEPVGQRFRPDPRTPGQRRPEGGKPGAPIVIKPGGKTEVRRPMQQSKVILPLLLQGTRYG